MVDYELPLYILSGFYFLTFLMAATQLALLVGYTQHPMRRDTKKTFRVLTMIVCAGRIYYNIWSPFVFYEHLNFYERLLELALPRIISLVYYSNYLLLVVVWARLFYSIQEPTFEVQSETRTKIDMFYIGANVFLVSVETIFITLFFITESGDENNKNSFYELLSANSIFLGALMIMWAVGFSWFGILLYINMQTVVANTFLRSRQLVIQRLRKVSIITGICTLCFLFRAVITCAFAQRKKLENPEGNFLMAYISIYAVGELIPFALVLTQGSPIQLNPLEDKQPLMEQRPPSTNIHLY